MSQNPDLLNLTIEVIAIARSAPYNEARDKIYAILDSILHIGERNGVERGVQAACYTSELILHELFGKKTDAGPGT
jgi:hypothetical protein